MIQLALPLGERCSLGRAFAWMLEAIECKPATLQMHLAHVGYLIAGTGKRGDEHRPGFGNVPVTAIGYPEIMAWYRKERAAGIAKETLKKRLSTLKLGLLAAHEHRELDRLPQFPSIKSDTRRLEGFWTRAELDRAIAECDDEDMAAWITVAWWCGFHPSDTDDFRWDDVDLARGTWIRRNSKTSVPPMALPLPRPFRDWLAERRKRSAPHGRDLVVGRRQGYPNAFLARLCERAGVPRISCIGLRHSCESHLYDSGADVASQIAWLGLTSERMLRVYRHPSPKRLDHIAKMSGMRMPPRKKFGGRNANRSASL